MGGKRKPSRAGYNRNHSQRTQLSPGFLKKGCKGFLNIGIMALVIGKKDMMLRVQKRNFYSGGTNVDSQ